MRQVIRLFATEQRDLQIAFRTGSITFSAKAKENGVVRGKIYPFMIPQGQWRENLHTSIREEADQYFGNRITWLRMKSPLLSSQVCCLNFLMPFATRPAALAQLPQPVFPNKTMLQIEDGRYIAFEWISAHDLLDEGRPPRGTRRRGENCTSIDAAIKFQRVDGSIGITLIEWRYTESYGSKPDARREQERLRRYSHLAFTPNGPLRQTSDYVLKDLFREPLYQLLRQQMLAYHVQKCGEWGSQRAVVLHIASIGNLTLQGITAPCFTWFQGGVTSLWRTLLVDHNDFISVSTTDLFGRFDVTPHPDLHEWAEYARSRYASLLQ